MQLGFSISGLVAALIVAPATLHAAAPYEINVIMPLSGGAAFLGKAEQRTLEILAEQVNGAGGIQGRPLQFVFHDDTSSPQIAVQLASQITGTKPAVLIGSSIVAMCNAMAPLMTTGPVQYCLSPGIHPASGSMTFTSSVSTHDMARAMVRYFRMRGWTRIAAITSTDATGQDADRGIQEALDLPENKSVQMVEHPHFTPTDVSVTAQIATIKAANPQALIAWTTGAPIATVFKGLAQAGLDIPVGTTDGNMTHAQMTQYAAFLPKQLYIASDEWPYLASAAVTDPGVKAAQQTFVAAFAKAGVAPDIAAALAWDPAQLLVAALRKLGPDATPEAVRAWLASLKGWAGVDGVYDFTAYPQRGLSAENVVVTRWESSQNAWVPVSQPAGAPLAQ
jgi:branched-chain amino acid transport system substrate-binding protein